MNEAEMRWLKKACAVILVLCAYVGITSGVVRALQRYGITPDGTCPWMYPGTRWESTDGTAWFEVTENKQCYGEIETEQGVQQIVFLLGNGYSNRNLNILPLEAVENRAFIEMNRTIWSGIAHCTRTKMVVTGEGKADLFPEEEMTLEFMRMETE